MIVANQRFDVRRNIENSACVSKIHPSPEVDMPADLDGGSARQGFLRQVIGVLRSNARAFCRTDQIEKAATELSLPSKCRLRPTKLMRVYLSQFKTVAPRSLIAERINDVGNGCFPGRINAEEHAHERRK